MNLLTNNEIDILNGINTNTIKMKFGERVNKIIDKMGSMQPVHLSMRSTQK